MHVWNIMLIVLILWHCSFLLSLYLFFLFKNIMLIVLTLWHCSWTRGSRTWPGTLCSSHQPTCGIFWFGWQWWNWWYWWWCGGCAYMQLTLSPGTYVKLSLKTNQASGSGVIGLNVERDKAREDQATFLLWRHYWLVLVDGNEILRYQCLWKYFLRYVDCDVHADIFHVLEADNLVCQYFSHCSF